MSTKLYLTGNYNTAHTTFGGLIYPEDFNTNYSGKYTSKGSNIARRIASDRLFDEQCKKNSENRNKSEFLF